MIKRDGYDYALSLFNDEKEEGNEEYNAFLEKFKPKHKKTSDDCYTPANVYEVVAEYVRERYGVDRGNMVRPFYPGGDFERFPYEENDVVCDNPPFSIIAKIVKFYMEKEIGFFVFAPGLKLLNYKRMGTSTICVGAAITYANGAEINTGFLTNLEKEPQARTAPELLEKLENANRENLKKLKKNVPRYEYPDEVLTTARLNYFSKYGIDFSAKYDEAVFVRAMDEQRKIGKTIFGGGLLLSRAAAARAAAARAAAARAADVQIFELSDAEKHIVDQMDKKETKECRKDG